MMTPFLGVMERQPTPPKQANLSTEFSEKIDKESNMYFDLVQNLKDVSPSINDAKKCLALILKKIPKEVYSSISDMLNTDHKLVSLIESL
jgi:hypothetical protein